MVPTDVLPWPRSRSSQSHPGRVSRRLPAEPVALAPTSNRKTPQEGHYISSMDGRAKRRKNQQKTMNNSEQWQQHRAFGALDWASQTHTVVVVDPAGKVIEDFEIEQSAFRVEKVSGRTPSLRLDSFCHRDQPGSCGRATVGGRHDRLSAQSQERSSLSGT